METKGWMMMRVLFNRFHEGSIEALLKKYTPQEVQEQIIAQTITANDSKSAWITPVDLLRRIHYSWLHPIIQQVPQEFCDHFLSALPEPHFLGLTKMMSKNATRIPLTTPVSTFFINELCAHLNIAELLPPTFLPDSKLNVLVNFSKQQIMELIDFLGLHDLADEMRFILNKNQLKILFSYLSPKKQKYLKMCMATKERFPVPRLALEQWKGTRQQLELMLHKRGLERLAKALAGQHHDLVWYVVHVLDTGRGMVLTKTVPLHEEPGITPYRVQQLTHLIRFIENEVDGE